jgi:SAM-dependent methyltransferase
MTTPLDPRPATSPADARRMVREGYDRASHAYRGDEADLEMSGYGHWLRRLARRIESGARVLDLGCGNGVPATREMAKTWTVTGVDLSPVQVERARALVPAATFVCADMTEVEFGAASFEAVVAFYSIINVPVEEHAALFARIARWLVPGGWLLAIVGRDPWTGVEQDFRGVAGVPMFWSHADVHRYRDWLAGAGFTIAEEGRQPEKGVPGYAVVLAQCGEPGADGG